jgi:hypothetical protein
MPLVVLVQFVGQTIVKSNIGIRDPPAQRWYLIGTLDIREECYFLANIQFRGLEHSATPMPGVKLQSLIRDLIPIESSAGPSQDKGKGRAVNAMDEGKSERECSVSLTISEYKGVFHGGDSCFVYDWIDDTHSNSSPEGPRESIDNWLTDQSYMDASKEPIE